MQNLGSSLAATLGAIGAGVFLKSSIEAAQGEIDAQVKLEAVLKSTGGQAGVTSKSIDSLAESMQKQGIATGETVKNAGALLLSYTEVKNEAGANNDVFDRALKVSTDLSAFWGTNLTTSVAQLGRALQDPVAGVTSLTRAHIALTEAQKNNIKTLASQGDILGAQKAILDAVEQKVGGTAAAIAKNDPFQRFSVSLTEFKEKVGADFIGPTADVLHVAEELFAVFGELPEPIRATAEGAAVMALAFVGISKAVGILGALKTALLGTAAAEGEAEAGASGFAAALGPVGVAVAVVGLGVQQLFSHLVQGKPNVDDVVKSLDALSKSGKIGGAVANDFGGNLQGLAKDLKQLDKGFLAKGFEAFSTFGAKNQIDGLNASLNQLADNEGFTVAFHAFQKIRDALLADGVSVLTVNAAFDPFFVHMNDLSDNTAAAATHVQSLTDKLHGLASAFFTDQSEKLGVDDAIDAAKKALDDLNNARLDAAGKGPKSEAAAQAEAQAYQSLADAQRSARDSSEGLARAQESLAAAQAKLSEFDNPTSQTIRSLERTQIVDRVVTTPDQVRQKAIDLLTFDQQNADKRAELQKGIADAQNQVRDAEQRVADATLNVGRAQQKVQEAAQNRLKVQLEAGAEIQADERRSQEAILAAGSALDKFAQDAQPGDGVLKSYLNSLLLLSQALDPSGALTKNLRGFINTANTLAALGNINEQTLGPYSNETFARLRSEASGSFYGPISADDRALLHKAGVPGFALGGIVPGYRGQPRLILAHGEEEVLTPEQRASRMMADSSWSGGMKVEQHNHYYDHVPKPEEQDYNNRELGWLIARYGRRA